MNGSLLLLLGIWVFSLLLEVERIQKGEGLFHMYTPHLCFCAVGQISTGDLSLWLIAALYLVC